MSGEQGRIYAILSRVNRRVIYIGSTNRSIKKRYATHLFSYSTTTVREVMKYGWEESYIICLEEFDNITDDELKRYEGQYIMEYMGNPYYTCVNHTIPNMSREEKRKTHIKHSKPTYDRLVKSFGQMFENGFIRREPIFEWIKDNEEELNYINRYTDMRFRSRTTYKSLRLWNPLCNMLGFEGSKKRIRHRGGQYWIYKAVLKTT